MNLSTLILSIAVVVALIFAIRYVIKNGSCGGCPGSKRCHAHNVHEGGHCGGSCSSCHGCSASAIAKPVGHRS
ncbi:MAG: FeoB-associated Cys-rich membrane protein [Ethanoligenens sp.]|uniref:FeoB-associated Cys-rich membrane protein n=1 Tax=Ethanoligenens sp. TaxID=2099655 RepID=UPI0039ECB4B8